jgi:hypothetical protein
LSQGEKDRAANINGVDLSNIYGANMFGSTTKYTKVRTTWSDVTIRVNNSDQEYTVASWDNRGNTMGIHSRGCGDASYNDNYRIPVDTLSGTPSLEDSIRAVEVALIDEMALETCFEGYRFGDLMRIAMHRAADGGGGFAENDFLARRVASRASATMENPWYRDADGDALYQTLYGDGHSLNLNWFLKQVDE